MQEWQQGDRTVSVFNGVIWVDLTEKVTSKKTYLKEGCTKQIFGRNS